MPERKPQCVLVRMRDTRTANTAVSISQYILLTNIYIYAYIYKDDLQLGKLKNNYFATQVYRKLRKNVSEPQTGIEHATF